jgi:hypothetical protein
MIIRMPANSPEAQQTVDANPGCHVWINGSEIIIFTGEDIPVSDTAPEAP